SHVVSVIQQHGTNPISFTIRRGHQTNYVSITPEVTTVPDQGTRPRVGISEWTIGMRLVRPGVAAQIYDSVDAMVSTFGALFSRKSDIKPQHLSGPVKIMNIYYVLFKSEQGWRLALWFSVIMNVNLALLNLLPIPVLDGGHIVLALIEGIRRRPVSPKLLQAVQTACAVLLIGYILYVTFYDAQDWRGPKGQSAPPAQKQK